MGETAGHVLQRVPAVQTDAFGHHSGHVVGEFRVGQIGLEERVADQHVKIKPWRHPKGRRRIEQAAEDYFQIEDFPHAVGVLPEFLQMTPRPLRRERRGDKFEVGCGEATSAGGYPVFNHWQQRYQNPGSNGQKNY